MHRKEDEDCSFVQAMFAGIIILITIAAMFRGCDTYITERNTNNRIKLMEAKYSLAHKYNIPGFIIDSEGKTKTKLKPKLGE